MLSALSGFMFLTSPLLTAELDVVFSSTVLFIFCLGPLFWWMIRGMNGMPLFEMFAGMHLVYYWMGFGRDYETSDSAKSFDSEPIWVVSLFLAAGIAVYYGVIARLQRGKTLRWKWLDISVSESDSVMWAWLMTILSVGFELAVQSGFIWQLVSWNLFRPIQTTFSAFAMLGVFRLSISLGEGSMPQAHKGAFFAALTALAAIHTVSGYLVVAGTITLVAGFGYMLGARRVPVLAFVLCLLIGSFLNLGKREWRTKYWDDGERVGVLVSFQQLITFSWIALENRLAGEHAVETSTATLIERATLATSLQRIAALTPKHIPYMQGDSYWFGLSLLLPQALSEERGNFNAAMADAALTYGFFNSIEAAEGTSISLGPISEAWMNGGWITVLLAGGFFGLFFASGVVMAWNRPVASLGFLSGVFFFYTLVNAMELFAGSTLMAFTRTYPLAMLALGLLAFSQRIAQGSIRLKRAPVPRPAVPAPQAASH